jgi:hypothetical protein
MMSYDFDYFNCNYLLLPIKPSKPRLEKDHTPAAARSYADDLEQYEKEIEKYQDSLSYYREQKNLRLKEFQDRLCDDYDITQAQGFVIWHKAWEHGHNAGLSEVCHYFDEFYEMASEFAALEKG